MTPKDKVYDGKRPRLRYIALIIALPFLAIYLSGVLFTQYQCSQNGGLFGEGSIQRESVFFDVKTDESCSFYCGILLEAGFDFGEHYTSRGSGLEKTPGVYRYRSGPRVNSSCPGFSTSWDAKTARLSSDACLVLEKVSEPSAKYLYQATTSDMYKYLPGQFIKIEQLRFNRETGDLVIGHRFFGYRGPGIEGLRADGFEQECKGERSTTLFNNFLEKAIS